MNQGFSGLLDAYLGQAGLSLRQVASMSGIPHRTIFNWLKGSQPRWHSTLPGNLHRLESVLGLTPAENALLQRLAGCFSARFDIFTVQEVTMESAFRISKGWFITGDAPDKYDIGVDPGTTHEDRPCITLIAKPDPVGFAVLAQQIKAENYHGKRVRFSAVLCSKDLENRAALFMRVSGPDGKLLAFDNMRERFISGKND